MRVLVLGGTGLSGPPLVALLVNAGHEVTVCHRGVHEVGLPATVEHVHDEAAGLTGETRDHLREQRPDVVVDMFAMTGEHATALSDAFRGFAGRVVVPSSIDVYRAYGRLHRTEPGPPDPVPLTEDSPLRARPSIDGAAYEKRAVEDIVMSDPELPGTILRFPAIYGPRDRRLSRYVQRMADGRPYIFLEEAEALWRFSRGYADNIAQATFLAVTNDRAAGRIYNVAEPTAHTERDWVQQIGRAADWHGQVLTLPIDHMPAHLLKNIDWRQHWVVDSTRIRQELGYAETVTPDEALRLAVQWERSHPPESRPSPTEYEAEDRAACA